MANPLRLLLHELIDYAGLFPPAALPMDQAVRNYAAYLNSNEHWALARFIVPASRLAEFAQEFSQLSSQPHWRLSVLVNQRELDLLQIAAFNQQYADAVSIDVIEIKADSVDMINTIRATFAPELTIYVEIPVDADPSALIKALQATNLRAKIRTGGVTPQAFPSPEDVLRFIASCLKYRVPFKATAGLHHPLRAEYRLTYEPDATQGTMFGFLNVFLTAVWLNAGNDYDQALQLLTERDPASLKFNPDGIVWRDQLLTNVQIAQTRADLAIAFGSCSFEEPIDEVGDF